MNFEKTATYTLLGIIVLATIIIAFPQPVQQLTGLATTDIEEGDISVDIKSQIGLEFKVATIDFGSGGIASGQQCILHTDNVEGTQKSIGCAIVNVGGTDYSFSGATAPLQLENIGTDDLKVDLYSEKDAQNFISGSNPGFQFKVQDDLEAGSCLNPSPAGWTSWDDYVGVGNPYTICTNLKKDNGNDIVAIHIKVILPDDADATAKTDKIYAVGTTI
jgi:hypothetical protein